MDAHHIMFLALEGRPHLLQLLGPILYRTSSGEVRISLVALIC